MNNLVLLFDFIIVLVLIDKIFGVHSGNIKCGVSVLNKNFSRYDYFLSEHRLVGGKESRPNLWPWTGEILYNNKHQCGCVLIHPSFVLTAAHCFYKSRRASKYTILLGGHHIYSGEMFKVSSIFIHPFYQTVANSYDLALVRITTKVPLNDTIKPICLPLLPPEANKMCVVTGWGRLNENGEKSISLHEIHVPVIPAHLCNNFYHYNGRVHPVSMLCAGYNTKKIDSCQGDSGGPLQCQNANGVWELQGVVSWGLGCARFTFPGVYTKVYAMVGWIRSQLLVHSTNKKKKALKS